MMQDYKLATNNQINIKITNNKVQVMKTHTIKGSTSVILFIIHINNNHINNGMTRDVSIISFMKIPSVKVSKDRILMAETSKEDLIDQL